MRKIFATPIVAVALVALVWLSCGRQGPTGVDLAGVKPTGGGPTRLSQPAVSPNEGIVGAPRYQAATPFEGALDVVRSPKPTLGSGLALSGKKVLLFHSDFGSGAFLESNLVATGLFTAADIDILAMTTTPPSLATLQAYHCIIVWTNFGPPSPVAQGDRLKEYVDAGGIVVLATYGYSSPTNPWEMQGGIMGNGYSPLDITTSPLFPFPRSLNFGTALTGHPLLAGVTDFTYGGNSNYVVVTLDPGAVLVGSDNFGVPVIAISASGRVIGINLYPESAFSKSPGVFRVFANACEGKAAKPANNPPVANAGADQIVECTGPSGASVTLNGTGSSDPDGDALTYSWSATGITFDNPASATPTATFPIGTTTVTLTVDDGKGGTSSDTVQIKVEDTTPPTITLNGDNPMTLECPAAYTEPGATAADICDPNPSS